MAENEVVRFPDSRALQRAEIASVSVCCGSGAPTAISARALARIPPLLDLSPLVAISLRVAARTGMAAWALAPSPAKAVPAASRVDEIGDRRARVKAATA